MYELANNSPRLSKHYKAKAVYMYYPGDIFNYKENQLSKEINKHSGRNAFGFLNIHKLIYFEPQFL